MIGIKISKRNYIFIHPYSGREEREFHILPTITWTWTKNECAEVNGETKERYEMIHKGKGLALEWGWWSLLFGWSKLKDKEN